MLGDKERAALTFASALSTLATIDPHVPLAYRADYGTQLRDAAAVLALMGESGVSTPQLQKAFNIVTKLRAQQKETTTQESSGSCWRRAHSTHRTKTSRLKGTAYRSRARSRRAFGSDLARWVHSDHEFQRDPAERSLGQVPDGAVAQQFASEGLVVANRGPDAVPGYPFSSRAKAWSLSHPPKRVQRSNAKPCSNGAESPSTSWKQNRPRGGGAEGDGGRAEASANRRRGPPPGRLRHRSPALLKGSDLKAFAWLHHRPTRPSSPRSAMTASVAAFSLTTRGGRRPRN